MRHPKKRSRPPAPRSKKGRNASRPKDRSDINPTVIEDGPSAAQTPASTPFPIVGIGASAGGLEAFSQLLKHLPDDTGMAFVLVQHLDPKHKTQLPALLSRATRMPVAEVKNGVAVKPNHIYVIPPNTNIALSQGNLKLTPRGDTHALHLSIDHFFQSLAQEQQSRAIGVILSGTGSDGALGLAEIKGTGGVTFAQDERSAKYSGMPLSAIQNGCVDFILPPEGIARELAKTGRHPYMAPILPEPELPLSTEEEQFKKILTLLRSAMRMDFFQYKDATIKRRIMRRMLVHTKLTLAEYVRHLEEHPEEVEVLYHDILINVTSFFRDPEAFEALRRVVFPEIMKTKPSDIRIWAPGCSTGQEAYSLAIALTEYLEDQSVRPSFHVFATDLSDPGSLEKARAGIYPAGIEGQMSPERLRRFFRKENGGYRIIKSIRDSCVFARQNVAVDPPFSRMDLISCRNVLIYFAPSLQQRTLSTFYYALNPTGFLVLGTSEAVGRGMDMFTLVDNKHKIYAKKATAVPAHHFLLNAEVPQTPRDMRSTNRPAPTTADFQKEADHIALGRYAPPSVLVNENLEILQFRGRTSPYLEPPSGEASFNVLRMARENLALELGAVIREAQRRNAPARKERVQVGMGRRAPEVNLEVVPLKLSDSEGRCFLICFEDARHAAKPQLASPGRQPVRPGRPGARETQLQRELTEAKEVLQALIEQHDAATEELKSANEEILSANEEFQSTNEELEAAKEELQSGNEELTTLNEELQSRNAELTQLNDDLSNLLASIRMPIFMVGPDLRIRRFNSAAGKVLGLQDTDVNRPIGNVRLTVEVPQLEALMWKVIDDVTVKEYEVQDREGRWHSLRLHPYRTADNKIHGAVIAMIDIDDAKRAQLLLQALQTYTQAIVDTVREPLVILEADLRVNTANQAFYQTFLTTPQETEGRHFFDLGNRQWNIPKLRTQLETLLSLNATVENLEVTCAFPHIGLRTMMINARLLSQAESQPQRILLAMEDITEHRRGEALVKQAEEELRASLREKEVLLKEIHHRVKNNLQIVSSLLNLRADAVSDPETLKLLKDSQDRIRAMALVHEKLYQSKDLSRVDMKTYIESLADSLLRSYGIDTKRIATNIQVESGPLSVDAAMPCGLILNELLCNAIMHAFPGDRSGEITIRLQENGQGRFTLTVRDNGVGLPDNLDVSRAESLGLAIVNALAEQLEGTLQLEQANGTTFMIAFSDLPARGKAT